MKDVPGQILSVFAVNMPHALTYHLSRRTVPIAMSLIDDMDLLTFSIKGTAQCNIHMNAVWSGIFVNKLRTAPVTTPRRSGSPREH
jgi:hypothetical protein